MLGLFADAAPYSKSDSIFSWYMNIVPYVRRYLVCTLQKRELCTCGCRGFCTFGAIDRVIAQSLTRLALGNAGLEVRAVLMEFRADWAQINMTFGTNNWSKDRMCWKCLSCKANRFLFRTPWAAIRHADVIGDIDQRLIRVVVLTRDALDDIFDAMTFQKKWRGRVLRRHFPAVPGSISGDDLQPRDRLLVGGDVVDMHTDSESLPIPCSMVWYRWDAEAHCNVVTPLLGVPGFKWEYVKVDAMHNLDCKGVTSCFAATVIRRLLECNAFRRGVTKEDYPEAMRDVSRALREWYKGQRGIENKSRIGRLTVGMLGPRKKPVLAAKAAEMRHSLGFFQALLEVHVALLDENGRHGTYLVTAGRALQSIYGIMQKATRAFTVEESDKLLCKTFEFLDYWSLAKAYRMPKHHVLVHLARDAAWAGNPRFYWTYADESMNMDVVRIAQSTHIAEFYDRCLSKWAKCDNA